MKYFLIGTDEKNRIPYNINKNRAVDIRTLTREGIGTLPMWNIIGMDLPDEGFFPDLICSPFVLMSENCIKTAAMYQPDIIYRGVKLWDKGSGVNRTYVAWMDLKAYCLDGNLYSMIFLFRAEGQTVLGNFHCNFPRYDVWKPAVLKLLATVQVRQERIGSTFTGGEFRIQ